MELKDQFALVEKVHKHMSMLINSHLKGHKMHNMKNCVGINKNYTKINLAFSSLPHNVLKYPCMRHRDLESIFFFIL